MLTPTGHFTGVAQFEVPEIGNPSSSLLGITVDKENVMYTAPAGYQNKNRAECYHG